MTAKTDAHLDGSTELGETQFMLVVIGSAAPFHQVIRQAAVDLCATAHFVHTDAFTADMKVLKEPLSSSEIYLDAVTRSRGYLDTLSPPEVRPTVVSATTLEGARAYLERQTLGGYDKRLKCLILIDGRTLEPSDTAPEEMADKTGMLVDYILTRFPFSHCEAVAYEEKSDFGLDFARAHTPRIYPSQDWILGADFVCCYTDFVQNRVANPLRVGRKRTTSVLRDPLTRFLDGKAGSHWGLHYFTGSVVAGTIADFEKHANEHGNPVLRGPSEHSLACGALARWQIDEAPFLIIVSSGMVDEFRGTLANLRESGAKGFILSAESPSEKWYPLQGTVHAAEDSRDVLAARRIPFVYIERPADVEERLSEAFTLYETGKGPVVILATPSVLERTRPLASPPSTVSADSVAAPRRAMAIREDVLERLTRVLNEDESRLLWQCGHLSAQELDLVLDISRSAGVALADSATRPGGVSRYRKGQEIPEYVGTLGLYGYSTPAHQYLSENIANHTHPAPWLFFLKSRICEASTPYTPHMLRNDFRVSQVTCEESHIAPFVDLPIVSRLEPLLRAVHGRLNVIPGVLEFRREAIARTRTTPDVIGSIPILPMTPHYFFRQLGHLLDGMISQEGYEYTGVFEAGRCGASALGNLPRTGPGYSGYYGRALMGDATQTIPALAFSGKRNVLGFLGDAAAALVPDILPTLIQQLHVERRTLAGNVSIFRLCNGGHSMIRTYWEGRHQQPLSAQTRTLNLVDEDWEKQIGPVTVRHRRIYSLDTLAIRAQLQEPGAINLYSVQLSHSNESEGLTLLSALGWQRG
ncbi:hypothetical protein ACFWB2_34665 [Streptomyces virginiae]|uniref:hypothetical protein n=1 Tax=Streptomyces virginiae TaxID=1961 RepID=UPI00367E18DC